MPFDVKCMAYGGFQDSGRRLSVVPRRTRAWSNDRRLRSSARPAGAPSHRETAVRPIHRRGTTASRGLEDRLADDAHEHHRRAAGNRRSRARRPSRRLHGQRGDRRGLADLHRRHRFHHLAFHRHERARGALCRRRRGRESRSHGLSGVSHGDRHLAGDHGAARLLRRRRRCSIWSTPHPK